MRTILPDGQVEVRVRLPKAIVDTMRSKSLTLPGCLRKEVGSEAHFIRVAVYNLLLGSIDIQKIKNILSYNKRLYGRDLN